MVIITIYIIVTLILTKCAYIRYIMDIKHLEKINNELDLLKKQKALTLEYQQQLIQDMAAAENTIYILINAILATLLISGLVYMFYVWRTPPEDNFPYPYIPSYRYNPRMEIFEEITSDETNFTDLWRLSNLHEKTEKLESAAVELNFNLQQLSSSLEESYDLFTCFIQYNVDDLVNWFL